MKLINLVSLSLLTGAFAKIHDSVSSVYELGVSPAEDTYTIGGHDALVYFSDRFGIAEHMSLRKGNPQLVDFLNQQYELHGEVSAKPNLFISVRGVSEFDQTPSFKVSSGHINKLLFRKFPKILSKHTEGKLYQLTPEIKVVTQDGTSDLFTHFQYFNEQLMQIWNRYTQGQQQVLTYKLTNDRLFINELSQLIHLGKSEEVEVKDTFFIELSSLLSIKRKIGEDSQTFQYSQKVLFNELQALTNKFNIVIFTEPETSKYVQNIHKRDYELSSVFSKRELSGVSGNGQFSSQESCEKATDKCNSHGKCIKVSGSKWGCACESTFNKTSSKTTNWAGYDCSKRDVSVQANLFLWTSIGLLVLLVGGIQLLSSIGNDPLPGVLEAATIPRKNI
ncbi:uncharacterized protein SPAPADRAFT_63643 [Spathaspora passalidarum NRRL Y-27907]|uniref:Vacuolar sorting protein Vps3844 C-terminal domain-containing protein n=1 Tax=Spathaspora passalidarum (strain NRRL Y-27907 / 11-Y1) TaxID=619300 RepID=G3AUT4_SPAPN|nr:uncharacterized protein SPAPADRAFT_63643 [Spathaspora passalidarum NRRL Y-27907]EGW30025.1 hypothetical protein SPAPADRAFT_63643 [Spathaspora passalidarum NRRL Y-27907]